MPDRNGLVNKEYHGAGLDPGSVAVYVPGVECYPLARGVIAEDSWAKHLSHRLLHDHLEDCDLALLCQPWLETFLVARLPAAEHWRLTSIQLDWTLDRMFTEREYLGLDVPQELWSEVRRRLHLGGVVSYPDSV
jgi:hypothetical protein